MPTKREITILSILIMLAIICATATAMSFVRVNAGNTVVPNVDEKYKSFDTAAYILKEHNGYVAVFSAKRSELLQVTNIPVNSLRNMDRLLLQTGITANTRAEVLSLLEDFNS